MCVHICVYGVLSFTITTCTGSRMGVTTCTGLQASWRASVAVRKHPYVHQKCKSEMRECAALTLRVRMKETWRMVAKEEWEEHPNEVQ
jgi:hypothetical protein